MEEQPHPQVRAFQDEALRLRRALMTIVSTPSRSQACAAASSAQPATVIPPLPPSVLLATETEREVATRCAELQSENAFLRSRVAEGRSRAQQSTKENESLRQAAQKGEAQLQTVLAAQTSRIQELQHTRYIGQEETEALRTAVDKAAALGAELRTALRSAQEGQRQTQSELELALHATEQQKTQIEVQEQAEEALQQQLSLARQHAAGDRLAPSAVLEASENNFCKQRATRLALRCTELERELASSARVLSMCKQAEARGAEREEAMQLLQAANLRLEGALLLSVAQPAPVPEPTPVPAVPVPVLEQRRAPATDVSSAPAAAAASTSTANSGKCSQCGAGPAGLVSCCCVCGRLYHAYCRAPADLALGCPLCSSSSSSSSSRTDSSDRRGAGNPTPLCSTACTYSCCDTLHA